jgi:hypothetical protein
MSLTKPYHRSASEDASDTELKHDLTLTKPDRRCGSEDTSEHDSQGQDTHTHTQHTHMPVFQKQKWTARLKSCKERKIIYIQISSKAETRGARFMIKEKSYCTIFTSGSRNHW